MNFAKIIQRALLSSDVNVKLVLEITKNLKERALKDIPPKGLSKKDHIISQYFMENYQDYSVIVER